MQLNECLPYDVRDVMRLLPADGGIRHKFRKFTLNPRVDGRARSVKAFAEDLGFTVVECDLPRGMNGRLEPDTWAETGFRIEINASLSNPAKRFAVLHEMGHYFRHSDLSDPLPDTMHFDPSGRTFYVDKQAESEANEFAEALLFGAGQLSAAYGLYGGDVDQLAKYFGVTVPVVQVALRKLSRQGGAAR